MIDKLIKKNLEDKKINIMAFNKFKIYNKNEYRKIVYQYKINKNIGIDKLIILLNKYHN